MKDYYSILLFTILLSGIAISGNAQEIDLSRAEKYGSDSLSQYMRSLYISSDWFKSGGKEYLYYNQQDSSGRQHYRLQPRSGKNVLLFVNTSMAEKLEAATGKTQDQRDPRMSSIEFDGENPDIFYFNSGNKRFSYNIISELLSEIESPPKQAFIPSKRPFWQRFSDDSTYFVYSYNHNLYLASEKEDLKIQLTSDGEADFSYASGRNLPLEGGFLFPSGSWLRNTHYYYSIREDRRLVGEMSVINSLTEPRPTRTTYKFPMPGDKHVVQYNMVVVNADERKAFQVDLEKYSDQKIEIPRFSILYKNPRYIYLLRKNRKNSQIDLCRVDAKTGTLTEVISEQTEPHYNEQMFYYSVLDYSDEIIWWSERNGKGQYFLYNRDGKLKNPITPPNLVAGEIVDIDSIARKIIFTGYGGEKNINPYYKFYYSVNFDGSGFTLLTPGDGTHSISLSRDKKYLLDSYSKMNAFPVHIVRDMKGRELYRLKDADMGGLFATGWRFPELIEVKAADDSTRLYGIMYLPFDLDKNKKYPLITNVYPGPQDDQIPLGFGIEENQLLAQLGFIVINIAPRGSSPLRGKEFYTYGYGNLRDYPIEDDRYSIKQLAEKYAFIDTTKVGIYGHSGGGFMTVTAMLTYPDFYKVGIASAGNHDNNIYTQWWGESFHGLKSDSTNNKSYIPTNIELASNLKGKLLLITGDMDINVHPAHTFRLAAALIKANKRFDMMVLPGKDHGLGDKYYLNLIRSYFVEKFNGDLCR